ncbi:MAG: RimK family alpha-L-glutamate ligase [Candidatus Nanohaloarchaea archaeon]
MNLLTITDDDTLVDRLDEHVDTVDQASIADARVVAGDGTEVMVNGTPLDDYDALYLAPNPQIAIFSRVFLETLLNHDITANIGPTAFFILAKKSYLYHVLAERNVPIPPTATVSTENGVSGLEDDLSYPLIGKKFEGFQRRDMSLLESGEELSSFAEHLEHGDHFLVLQEKVDGDVYDCLYIDGDVVSLSLDGEGWRKRSGEATESYHSISSSLEEVVADAAQSIGADICRVRLVGDTVVDAALDPALERFHDISGKNVYGNVADMLEG